LPVADFFVTVNPKIGRDAQVLQEGSKKDSRYQDRLSTILPEGASFIASGNSAMLEIPSGSNPEGLKRGDIPVAFRN
jgi:hypothetical protein